MRLASTPNSRASASSGDGATWPGRRCGMLGGGGYIACIGTDTYGCASGICVGRYGRCVGRYGCCIAADGALPDGMRIPMFNPGGGAIGSDICGGSPRESDWNWGT